MSFLTFFLYYLVCTTIIFVIGFIITKLIIRKKCDSVSKIAEKEILNYFNSYDDNFKKGEGFSDDDSINR